MSNSVRAGAIFWVLTLELFLAQFIPQIAWPEYSMITNDISLLGATVCGIPNPAPNGVAYVCSPLGWVFNGGMGLNGILVTLGAWLTRGFWPNGRLATASMWFLALGGIGSSIAGIFPFNVSAPLHTTGAVLALCIGVFGFLLIAAAVWNRSRAFALYSAASGIAALIGFGLYGTGAYLGLGRGVVERLAAWPQTLWYITTGVLLLAGYFNRQALARA